ncbi:MAG TPA: hypothetical protein VFM10_12345, partial [Terriglobales bacterium]|nr:hypothetical protein [Terriglobales bacterium]
MTTAVTTAGTRAPRRVAATAGHWFVIVVSCVLLGFPFYWMFITTFKQTSDLYNLEHNPFKFNAPMTLEHLKYL